MKVKRTTDSRGDDQIRIAMTPEEAELAQTALLQFTEKTADRPSHRSRMRRLTMLIDRAL